MNTATWPGWSPALIYRLPLHCGDMHSLSNTISASDAPQEQRGLPLMEGRRPKSSKYRIQTPKSPRHRLQEQGWLPAEQLQTPSKYQVQTPKSHRRRMSTHELQSTQPLQRDLPLRSHLPEMTRILRRLSGGVQMRMRRPRRGTSFKMQSRQQQAQTDLPQHSPPPATDHTLPIPSRPHPPTHHLSREIS